METRIAVSLSSGKTTSRHSHTRELRTQSGGEPLRTFYTFDPGWASILPIGGTKTGNDRFPQEYMPIAEVQYDDHLNELREEGHSVSGRHQFQDSSEGFAPERRRRIEARKAELTAEMALRELRQAMAFTQQDLADRLRVRQPAVAKLEQRTDMYISSLRSYIESIGGKLRIVASFPAGDVAITNFSSVSEPIDASAKGNPPVPHSGG